MVEVGKGAHLHTHFIQAACVKMRTEVTVRHGLDRVQTFPSTINGGWRTTAPATNASQNSSEENQNGLKHVRAPRGKQATLACLPSSFNSQRVKDPCVKHRTLYCAKVEDVVQQYPHDAVDKSPLRSRRHGFRMGRVPKAFGEP